MTLGFGDYKMFFILGILLIPVIFTLEGLEKHCYECPNVLNISDCTTVQCDNGYCTYKIHTINGVQLHSLGCSLSGVCHGHDITTSSQTQKTSEQRLTTPGVTQQTSTIVDSFLLGRSLHSPEDMVCNECCNTNLCNKHLCPKINGMWSEWGSWGPCSVTCGAGTYSRSRSCSNPSPQNGGETCYGDEIQHTSCGAINCADDSGWSSWGACTGFGETGLQSRTKTLLDSTPKQSNTCKCEGMNKEYQLCQTQEPKASLPKTVAFHLTMSEDTRGNGEQSMRSRLYTGPSDVIFSRIVYSEGVDSSDHPIQFVAAKNNGTYYFSVIVDLQSVSLDITPVVNIVKESNNHSIIIAAARARENSQWSTLTANTITHLVKGDRVKCALKQGIVTFNGAMTSFTGFLIS